MQGHEKHFPYGYLFVQNAYHHRHTHDVRNCIHDVFSSVCIYNEMNALVDNRR